LNSVGVKCISSPERRTRRAARSIRSGPRSITPRALRGTDRRSTLSIRATSSRGLKGFVM